MNVISAFLLIFFSLFLITRKGQNHLSNYLLAGFLLINSVPFLFDLFPILVTKIFKFSSTLFLSIFTLDFLMGPLVYFYTKSLAYRDFGFRKRDGNHLLPVLLFQFYLVFSFLLNQVSRVSQNFGQWEIRSVLIISHLLLVIYACKSVQVLRRFTASIKNTCSYMEKINLSWLRFVLVGFGVIWLMVIINCLVRIIWTNPIPHLNEMISVASFVVAITIIYYGLSQPKIFAGIDSRSKYLHSTLTIRNAQTYTIRLKEYMKSEKPHLIPSLTVNHLAEKLEIPARHLSQLVNEQFQQNFFDFINSHRVEEAKKFLSKKSRTNFNISQILYEVGFNSKAAFNRAFLKHVGMSPKEFKKQAQN